ncbi:MAG: VOC family protein [Alphaproteobacteria bacterium]|nr:VOC family protein [Alphaproteobacteria bacterium]
MEPIEDMSKEPKLNPLIPELLCTNVETSLAFYTQVLGFKVLYQRPETRFAMVEREGAQIMLDEIVPESPRTWIAGPLDPPFGRGMNLEIGADDVQRLYECAVAAQAHIFLPLEEKWYRAGDVDLGVRQFIVQDPDGYLLRFSESMGTRPTQNVGSAVF